MRGSVVSQKYQLEMGVLRLRYWHHVMNEHLKEKRFKIPIHLAFGHEAIAVAVSHMMKPEDQLVLTHRNIAYNLARAGSLNQIYEEYKLASTGVGEGRLGAMNLANPGRGIVYTSSILGNNIPVACGLALGNQIFQRSGIVIVLVGDGAMEEGTFYEGIVFAKSQNLGLLVVVENNDHSLASTISERRCPISLPDMCASVDVPYMRLSGNDVAEYSAVLETARAKVEGSTPVYIEVDLVTFNQHAGPTPGWATDPKNISIENGLIVEQTSNDPVFVLQQNMEPRFFDDLTSKITTEESKWMQPPNTSPV